MLKVHRKKPLERQLKIGEAWENRDLVFPDLHGGYFNQGYLIWLFLKLLREAGVPRMHFHDLRHEAISRFFEMGLSIPEVALISGHKDPKMLFRYTNLRATDVAGKLHALAGS